MNAGRLRLVAFLLAGLLALTGNLWMGFRASRPSVRLVEHRPQAEPSPTSAPYVLGFLLAERQWQYRLFRDTNEQVVLEIDSPEPLPVVVSYRTDVERHEYVEVVREKRLDLTPYLPERGEFFAAIQASAQPPGFQQVRFIFELPPQPFHWGSFLFFTVLSVVCWMALAGFLLPLPLSDVPLETARSGKWLHRIVAYLVALVVLLIVIDGHWWRAKDFDDQYALGPSAAMARHGYDPDRLFFRSRVRPAFPAFSIPLQAVLPLQFASTSRWNTDDWKRWFDKYDRPSDFFADFIYLKNTLLALALLIGAGFLIGRMGRALGLDRTQGLAATGLTLLLLLHILDNVITFSFTTAMIWATPAAAIWALSSGGRLRCMMAGLIAGAAVLSKETAVSISFAIAFLLLLHLLKRQHWRRRSLEVSLYVLSAAILPLIYYTLIIPGGFGNLVDLFEEHALQQRLYPHSYITLTPSEALRNLWMFGGILPLVALLGFIRDRRRANVPNLGSVFFLLWTLGACSIFFSPYVLPRFFNDFIPPLAFFCALIVPRPGQPK